MRCGFAGSAWARAVQTSHYDLGLIYERRDMLTEAEAGDARYAASGP